jgi:SM-20-related protein
MKLASLPVQLFSAASAFTSTHNGVARIHFKGTHQLHVATQSQLWPQITQEQIGNLSNKGYVIIPNFLPQNLVDELRDDILELRSGNAFREAKIGQDSTNNLNKSIRIAETCFIGRNRPELTRITGDDSIRDRRSGLYDILDGLCDSLVDLCWKESQAKLDKSLTELLYAYYPSGGFYRRHRDAIPNSASVLRKYSLLLYLNRDSWNPDTDAGQLRIHLDGGGDECPAGVEPKFIDVDPLGGTLVLFKSELIPHEVLDTNSERFALVGWYNRAVTASDIGNLRDGGGGDMVGVGMLAVALLLVTIGVSSILG